MAGVVVLTRCTLPWAGDRDCGGMARVVVLTRCKVILVLARCRAGDRDGCGMARMVVLTRCKAAGLAPNTTRPSN